MTLERELERLVNERVLAGTKRRGGEGQSRQDKKQYNAKGGLPVFREGERSRTGAEGGRKQEKWQEALKKNGFATEEEYRNSVLTDNGDSHAFRRYGKIQSRAVKGGDDLPAAQNGGKKLTRVEESELLKERDMLTDEKAKAAERGGAFVGPENPE